MLIICFNSLFAVSALPRPVQRARQSLLTTLPLMHLQSSTAAPVCSSCQQPWEWRKAVTTSELPPEHLKRKAAGVSYCMCSSSHGNSHVQQFPRHSHLPCAHDTSFSQTLREKYMEVNGQWSSFRVCREPKEVAVHP